MAPHKKRPTSILVVAILNFVFGGFGFFGSLCGMMSPFLMKSLAQAVPPMPGGGVNPATSMFEIYDRIPSLYIATMVSGAVHVGLSIMLIVGGIGLLKVARWARTLCFIYCAFTILSTLIATIYTITVVNPAVEKFTQELMQDLAKQAGPGAAVGPMPMNSSMNGAASIFGALFSIAYSVALLVVLLLPEASAAFAGTWKPPQRHPDEDYDDRPTRRQASRSDDTSRGDIQEHPR